MALGKEVTQVHADLLNGAATEAKAAAELRKVALSLSTQAATSDAGQKLEVTRVAPVWIRERG